MAFELDVDTCTQYPNSLYIDILAPDVQEALAAATRDPIDKQTFIPDALTEAMKEAQSVCVPCIIYQQTRLQSVGPDREATCPGMGIPKDDESLIHLINSKRAGRATLKVQKTRQSNYHRQILTMPCEVVPALLFPDSSAIQQGE
ncbi:MAG: hypothetical protein AAB800_00600 [Patescibacteria group bacterium]